tara:strand:+ start:83 stop:460 length:378 start_codon:yes stop_codon:yes gene_type:complete
MRRKRHTPIFVRKCDHCGTELQTNEPGSDSYVITAAHQIFCKIHYVGEEPIKDCLEDYIRSKKNVRTEQIFKKEKEQRWLQSDCKKQPEEIKKEKEVRLKNLEKLEAYKKELKLKQWQKRKENHL